MVSEKLIRAREAAAAYWKYRRGWRYKADADIILERKCDFSNDVQSALIAILVSEYDCSYETAVSTAHSIALTANNDQLPDFLQEK